MYVDKKNCTRHPIGMGLLRDNMGPLHYFFPTGRIVQPARPSAVFVNGYFTTRACGATLVHAMGGPDKVMQPALGGMAGEWQTARVDTSARLLATSILSLPADQRPWLVGHSLGGVICRYAVHTYGLAERVAGVITLGTPHQGVRAIALAFVMGAGLVGPAALDLFPNSRPMKVFAKKGWPYSIPLISIAGRKDRLCPNWASRLRTEGDMCRFITIDGLAHNELIRHQRALSLVRSFVVPYPQGE